MHIQLLNPDGSHERLWGGEAPVNLLDNSYFAYPVNQRGGSTYTGSWIYSLDRWLISGVTGQMTLEKTATGVTLSTANGEKLYFAQRIALAMYDAAKTYTQCYMDGGGQVHIIGPYVQVDTGGGFAQFAYYVDSGTTMRWAAVYEGAYTLDTLPPYTPKGYVTELMRCLRYALAYDTIERVRACVCSTNYIDFHVATPVPLRIVPSIEQNAMKIIPLNGGTAVDGFAFSILGRTASYLRVRATKTAHGLTDAVLELASVGTRTVFTADL